MRCHHDQVDAQPRRQLENFDCRIARDYVQFIAGSGLEFLMADLLKFSSRLGFRFAEGQHRFDCRMEMDDVKQIQSRIVLLRKLRRNGNRRERVLAEIHRAQNVTTLGHLHPI